MPDTTALGLLFATALAGGTVRGFAGFGGPMVLLPVATYILGPSGAVWVVIAMDLLTSIPLTRSVLPQASRCIVQPLTIGTLLTLPAGAVALVHLDAELMRRIICGAILTASLVMLSGWRWRGELSTKQWTAVGALAGLVIGLTSLAVTAALFLHSGRSTAAEARANFIVWVFIAGIALLAVLALQGGMPPGLGPACLAVGPAYYVGTVIGARLYGRVPDATGRRIVLALVATSATIGLLR
jgi:uncharacterized membrane protein YfcA